MSIICCYNMYLYQFDLLYRLDDKYPLYNVS